MDYMYDDSYEDDMYEDMMYPDYDDVQEYSRVSISDLLYNCIIPTMSQASQTIFPLCLMCFVFKTTIFLGGSDKNGEAVMPYWFPHLSSAAFGGMALYLVFQDNIVYILLCGVLAYLVLFLSYQQCRQYTGIVMSMFIVTFVILCELVFVESKAWHNVRGAQIILSMKLIGLAFDISSEKTDLPGGATYLGYVFCVGTVIFGPWTSYHDYLHAVHQNRIKSFSLQWLVKVVRSSILCMVSVVLSTCLTHWLILDDSHKIQGNKISQQVYRIHQKFIEYIKRWLVACRDAQSFRISHYFVSFVSETTATLSGLGFGEVAWGLTVSKPQYIELPRSLVDVVTNWNLPMHFWLKNYVFEVALPYGAFIAVLLTYAASSLLHGLNFQLAAVLFSLGFYTYVESVFRSKLSKTFNACIKARKCREECNHEYKYNHPYVIVTNIIFGALAMFHLAYLGLMFDSSADSEQGYNMGHTLGKWSSLSFASHWVVMGTYLFHLLI